MELTNKNVYLTLLLLLLIIIIINVNTLKSGATPGRLSRWVCIRVVILNSSSYFDRTIHGHDAQAAGKQSKSHVRNNNNNK